MKILYIQPYCPTSLLVGGELRNRRFVDYLTKRAQVDIFILMKLGKETDWEYLKTRFHSYYFAEKIKALGTWDRLRYLLPWELFQFYAKETQCQLNRLVEEEQYDYIFANKLYSVPYLLRLPKKWHQKIIVDFDDILSDLHRSSSKDFIKSLKVSFFLKINEEMALQSFRRIFVCAEEALSKIHSRFHEKVGIAPNVFYTHRENIFPTSAEKRKLLFVGSLDYSPNAEGLEWFLKAVWPRVRAECPGVKLTVIGKAPRPERVLRRFGGYADITIDLNVPEVKPYYRDAYVTIVPLLNGSGTRIKILESYAYGRPVITTPKGVEGLDFKDQKEILVFRDPQTFIDAYRYLLDEANYQKTWECGFKVLEDKYSLRTFERSMDRHWHLITQS